MAVMFVRLETRLKSFMLSLTLEVDDELVALVGRSGAGKSVVLRSIAGVHVPDSGLVAVRDRTVFSTGLGVNFPPPERRIGYVPQNHALFPHLTVCENIGFSLRRQLDWTDERAARRVDEVVELLGLEHVGAGSPEDLSDVDRQRVAVARALVLDPDVLLLDDPFSSLGDDPRRQAYHELAELRRRIGIPAVIATESFEDTYEVADRVAVIEQGRILQVDPPSQLLAQPRHPQVVELTRSVNIFRGSIMSGDGPTYIIETPIGTLHVANADVRGGDIDIVVRPEHIRLLDADADPNDSPNVIRGRFVEESLRGATHVLVFEPDRPADTDDRDDRVPPVHVHVSSLAYQQLGLSMDEQRCIEIPPHSIRVMQRAHARE
jgi:ABC-type sulfate/molybdate transport systems ATPase subunit